MTTAIAVNHGRRSFLKSLFAGLAGIAASRLLPTLPKFQLPEANYGVSMRMVKEFVADKAVYRYDVLYGFATIRPEYTCTITEDLFDYERPADISHMKVAEGAKVV